MRIQVVFLIIAAQVGLLVVAQFVLNLRLHQQSQEIPELARRHFETFRLAQDLIGDVNQMTRMARLYVFTGGERHRLYFEEILAIRNGEAPRPPGYSATYWDEVLSGDRKHVRLGQPEAYRARLARLVPPGPERVALVEALGLAGTLAGQARDAVETASGRIKDPNGGYTAVGEPRPTLAQALINSADYLRLNAAVMRAIDRCLRELDRNQGATLEARSASMEGQTSLLLGANLLATVISALALAYAALHVVRPINALSRQATRIAGGDYAARNDVRHGNELGLLGQTLNRVSAVIVSDIAAQKEVARALDAARDAADAANRAKSVFLAAMSHEIRTPMNGVLGLLELLNLTPLNPEQRTTVAIIRDSGLALQRIIDDILDFSKIEAGKLEIVSEPVSIATLVEKVRDAFSGNASSKGLSLRCDVDPRISPAVSADPMRLRQILGNFVSNALKFTPEGHVELRADLLERGADADRIAISVTDTGIGIAAEDQAHLLEPFTQATRDTTSRFGGTGLGLAICRRLAELMGGSIAMRSARGEGTTMTLTLSLPRADPAHLPARLALATDADLNLASRGVAPPSIAQAEQERRLVLAIDDHPTNRLLLLRQLELLGYAAQSAGDGVEGLRLWQTGRYALVIADCHMAEMDGYELARNIRRCEADQDLPHTPIIACTALALSGEAQGCFDAGMDDYLAKPFSLAQLKSKLDAWLPLAAAPTADTKPGPAPVPEYDGATFDDTVLNAVTGGDSAVEREILVEFRNASAQDQAMLEAAASREDIVAVARMAHRIKGASEMIGARAIAGVSGRIEQAARSGDWQAVKEQIPMLKTRLQDFDEYLGSS